MKQQAESMLADWRPEDGGELPWGLCLYQPAWHQGVIGILASRIKDQFHRPVIAFANAGEGELKGSARSVSGLHIRDALDAVATRHPGLVSRFGGHAMAAGMSIGRGQLPAFASALERYFIRPATWLETALFTLAAAGLFWTELWADVLGWAAFVTVVLLQKFYDPFKK